MAKKTRTRKKQELNFASLPEAQKVLEKHLPRFFPELIPVFILAFISAYYAEDLANRQGTVVFIGLNMIAMLPILLYWTHCIFRISQISARMYNAKMPIAPWLLMFLSVVSISCLPCLRLSSNVTFIPFWLDPTFPFWIFAQLLWPTLLYSHIHKQQNPESKLHFLYALLLALAANAYLLISPLWENIQNAFTQFWFVSQFGCIFFLKQTLLSKGSTAVEAKVADLDKEVATGKDIVIRYRSFAAVERWRNQQQQALNKEMRTIIAVAVPMLILSYCAALSILNNPEFKEKITAALGKDPSAILKTLSEGAGTNPTAASSSTPDKKTSATTSKSAAKGQADTSVFSTFLTTDSYTLAEDSNSSFLFVIGLAGLGIIASIGAFAFVNNKPTHLGLNQEGWHFIWRRSLNKRNGSYIRWRDLQLIYMDIPKGKTSVNDACLSFKTKKGTVKQLKMDAIDSVEDKELLLKCLNKWAPTVSRSPSVIEALLPPKDHSYTEIWMQALSAAPKRERLKPLLNGTSLKNGSFKVIRPIGTGGQGQAYLAENTGSTEQVVLKEFILPVFVDVNVRRAALEQFENEAKILRQLDHPQIVKLIDFFIEDHRSYLVLEHITGSSLLDMVKKKGKLPEQTVKELALQMCDILSYLHGLTPPVIHRDFTPDNLILNNNGTLKLIDFNVAKKVVESTTSGTVVGKHAYLPPEQFRGMPECSSDIYSMGGTLHFLLTATQPEPISVSHPKFIVPELSDRMNSLIEKCTALDSKKRFGSPDELRRELA